MTAFCFLLVCCIVGSPQGPLYFRDWGQFGAHIHLQLVSSRKCNASSFAFADNVSRGVPSVEINLSRK
jgi:hypothetical protein